MIPWSFSGGLPRAGIWDLEESERFCLRMASSHYENFPVVSCVLDDSVRRSLAAVYAFARTADDFVDEPAFEGARLSLIDAWEEQLHDCFRGRSRHPVFIALRSAILRHGLDREPLDALLSAFRQDCAKQRYETMDDLLDYCLRSANPVGRLVLRIMEIESTRTIELSDRTCTALQLANFWQDLSVDIPRGRLYVPLETARAWGVSEAQLMARQRTAAATGLVQSLVREARAMMQSARALPLCVRQPAALYLEAVQRGGLGILSAVERLGSAVLDRRPRLRRRDAALILLGASTSTLPRWRAATAWSRGP